MSRPVYAEPHKSYQELASVLKTRGMGGDVLLIESRLREVGYKRLSSYWLPYKRPDGRIECDIDKVWLLYCFDRRIRLSLLDAIERIEVGVRNRCVHYYTEIYGPFGHRQYSNFDPLFQYSMWKKMIEKMDKEAERAKRNTTSLISQFYQVYANAELPLWLQCEVMDFGSTVVFLEAMQRSLRKRVASDFGLKRHDVLISWMKALNDVRNSCAHHNRVWNRVWVNKPSLPKKDTGWYKTDGKTPLFSINKTGVVLTMCNYMLNALGSTSRWKQRLYDLFEEPRFAGNIPCAWMGLPEDWRDSALWK